MAWYYVRKGQYPEGEICEKCLQPLTTKDTYYIPESHNDEAIKNPKLLHGQCQHDETKSKGGN